MPMFNSIPVILLQPSLYTLIVALVLAFYLVWALAKQQYLGVSQQFDVLAISLASGLIGLFAIQIIYPGFLNWPVSWDRVADAFSQPISLAALVAGYSLAILCSWQYIRRIHYPYWRVIDSNVLGLSLVILGQLVGLLLSSLTIAMAIVTVVWAILLLVQLVIYQKIDRPGLTSGIHLMALFCFCLSCQYIFIPWQGLSSGVEYGLASLMVITGITVIVRQWRAGSKQVITTPLPTGVSQRFRDTFARALLAQPSKPSQPDGSSHT